MNSRKIGINPRKSRNETLDKKLVLCLITFCLRFFDGERRVLRRDGSVFTKRTEARPVSETDAGTDIFISTPII